MLDGGDLSATLRRFLATAGTRAVQVIELIGFFRATSALAVRTT
ncbi:hypothetical protein MXAN_3369 [Myxococcus xanthus DK 1622]|uniref:Uncharacterized protein n=1 Tax=Myxococcus xanthus (strain DK1622) TaxID=246197 RepID=Q1D707_MYXXD|nr:hypothetical protein MXAN_3369 [Myxococcus xanthus DK 1622]